MAQRGPEAILKAAVELFSEKGYHATSMRDIAQRLGMQAGSLYAHIKSKDDLLFTILERAADQFMNAVRQALRSAEAQRLGAADRLRLAMRAHFAVMADNLATATVFFHELKAVDEPRRRLILAKRDEYESLFRAILADGMARGEFRKNDLAMSGLALMSLCNWFYQWYSPHGSLSAEEIADRFADLYLRGLLARAQDDDA